MQLRSALIFFAPILPLGLSLFLPVLLSACSPASSEAQLFNAAKTTFFVALTSLRGLICTCEWLRFRVSHVFVSISERGSLVFVNLIHRGGDFTGDSFAYPLYTSFHGAHSNSFASARPRPRTSQWYVPRSLCSISPSSQDCSYRNHAEADNIEFMARTCLAPGRWVCSTFATSHR